MAKLVFALLTCVPNELIAEKMEVASAVLIILGVAVTSLPLKVVAVEVREAGYPIFKYFFSK